jgi:hypothetical protein
MITDIIMREIRVVGDIGLMSRSQLFGVELSLLSAPRHYGRPIWTPGMDRKLELLG